MAKIEWERELSVVVIIMYLIDATIECNVLVVARFFFLTEKSRKIRTECLYCRHTIKHTLTRHAKEWCWTNVAVPKTEITIIANVMRFRRLRVVAFSCFVYNFFLLFRQTTVSAPILMLPNPVPHRAKIVPKFIYLSFLVLFSSVDSYIYYYFVNSVYRFVVESLANGWLYFRIFSCLV